MCNLIWCYVDMLVCLRGSLLSFLINEDVNNYRPISLLPAISKIIEKVIYNQTYNYFDQNKILYAHQYGFRKQHSTELAVLELVDRTIYFRQR